MPYLREDIKAAIADPERFKAFFENIYQFIEAIRAYPEEKQRLKDVLDGNEDLWRRMITHKNTALKLIQEFPDERYAIATKFFNVYPDEQPKMIDGINEDHFNFINLIIDNFDFKSAYSLPSDKDWLKTLCEFATDFQEIDKRGLLNDTLLCVEGDEHKNMMMKAWLALPKEQLQTIMPGAELIVRYIVAYPAFRDDIIERFYDCIPESEKWLSDDNGLEHFDQIDENCKKLLMILANIYHPKDRIPLFRECFTAFPALQLGLLKAICLEDNIWWKYGPNGVELTLTPSVFLGLLTEQSSEDRKILLAAYSRSKYYVEKIEKPTELVEQTEDMSDEFILLARMLRANLGDIKIIQEIFPEYCHALVKFFSDEKEIERYFKTHGIEKTLKDLLALIHYFPEDNTNVDVEVFKQAFFKLLPTKDTNTYKNYGLDKKHLILLRAIFVLNTRYVLAAFPECAKQLLDLLLSNKELYNILEGKEMREFARDFPRDITAYRVFIVDKICQDAELFERIIPDAKAFFNFVKACPDQKAQLISFVLDHPTCFKAIFSHFTDFCKLATIFPDYKTRCMKILCDDVDYLSRLINDYYEILVDIAKAYSEDRRMLIKAICQSDVLKRICEESYKGGENEKFFKAVFLAFPEDRELVVSSLCKILDRKSLTKLLMWMPKYQDLGVGALFEALKEGLMPGFFERFYDLAYFVGRFPQSRKYLTQIFQDDANFFSTIGLTIDLTYCEKADVLFFAFYDKRVFDQLPAPLCDIPYNAFKGEDATYNEEALIVRIARHATIHTKTLDDKFFYTFFHGLKFRENFVLVNLLIGASLQQETPQGIKNLQDVLLENNRMARHIRIYKEKTFISLTCELLSASEQAIQSAPADVNEPEPENNNNKDDALDQLDENVLGLSNVLAHIKTAVDSKEISDSQIRALHHCTKYLLEEVEKRVKEVEEKMPDKVEDILQKETPEECLLDYYSSVKNDLITILAYLEGKSVPSLCFFAGRVIERTPDLHKEARLLEKDCQDYINLPGFGANAVQG